MPNQTNLTGRWAGLYYQHDHARPIAAEFVQEGARLTGRMTDGVPDHELSVFEYAAESGLPPGADETIVERLRTLFPDAPESSIRFVTHLPPESTLDGAIRGETVSFLKTYEGPHYGGFTVGDKIVGNAIENHSVHYEGRVSPDGEAIEGRWWIDPPPGSPGGRLEGPFTLQRARPGAVAP